MDQSGFSTKSKLAIAAFVSASLLAVIFLISTEHASDHSADCTVNNEILQTIQPADAPQDVPDVTFFKADGSKTTLDDYAGRGVILNLWATWCAPCVREMPELDALKADLAGDNIDVLAVSSDRAGHTAIAEFYKRTGIKNLDALHDPKNVAGRALGVRGLPTTLIINPDGKEVARIVGIHKYDTDESKAYFRRCVGTLS